MDIKERKQKFMHRIRNYASAVIKLYCSLPKKRREVTVIANQLLRSGTSVAANYRGASRSRSNAEFVSKVEMCVQEADESDLWLELLEDDCGIRLHSIARLRKETNELIAIFVTMAKNVKRRIGE